jgi:hypothetical protein
MLSLLNRALLNFSKESFQNSLTSAFFLMVSFLKGEELSALKNALDPELTLGEYIFCFVPVQSFVASVLGDLTGEWN